MRRVVFAVVAVTMMFAAASTVGAAPPPTPDGVNHPAFPQQCSGGQLGEDFFGWAVLANGSAVANGTLPTGFIYEGGDLTTPPDFSTGEPILGVSMYRTVVVLDEANEVVAFTGQRRADGNGNQAPDEGQAVYDGIEWVTNKWDVAVCTVAIPGFILADLYPDADPPYVPTYSYILTNYLK